MENEDYRKFFNLEVFKINSITTQKNFIVYDSKKNFFYHEIDLFRVFEIFKDRNCVDFLKYFSPFFVDKEFIKEKSFKLLEENKKENNEQEIQEFLIEEQKAFFRKFRFFIVPKIICCDVINFYPINKRVVDNKGLKELNIYSKSYNLQKPKNNNIKSFPSIEFLFQNIFQEGYEKFIDLLAWKKQKPLELIPSHWVIQDDGGTGKSEILVDYVLSRLFNIEIIMQEDLESSFNGYIKNSEFLVCEEIEGYSNEKKMKVLTGAKYLTINDKYTKTFKIRNYNNVIIFTNDLKGLKISYDDRRFNVVGGGLRLSPLKNESWNNTLFESREKNQSFFENFHKNIDVELWNLNEHLKVRKVDRLELQIPINNARKLEMQKINNTSEFDFIEELFELGLEGFIEEYSNFDKRNFLVEEIHYKDNKTYVNSKAMYKLYIQYCKISNLKPISKNHFARRLKKTHEFNLVFKDIVLISRENKKYRCYEFRKDFG